jgi:nucleoside-diphosphate-sugar epimerase
MAVAVVFGANGFIGSPVAAAVRWLPGTELVGVGLGPKPTGFPATWFDLDIMAVGAHNLAARIRDLNPTIVINCIGLTAGTDNELVRSNVGTTSRLLRAVDTIGTRGVRPRFVHIGSAAEYGRGQAGEPISEEAEEQPVSPYGAIKLIATQLVVSAAEAGAVDGIVLRVFNAIGPAMPPGTLAGAAIHRLREAIAAAAPQIEMGPLDAVRDFVDVRDVGSAVAAACSVPSLGDRIVNVGSGTPHTARELVELLAARIGFHGTVAEQGAGSPRSSDVPWQVADVSLAERALGWRAVHDLASSVDTMVASKA